MYFWKTGIVKTWYQF